MNETVLSCHQCGLKAGKGRVEFRALCEGCSGFLHCCMNCRHYDQKSHHECRSWASVEYVKEKDGINFCEEFVPGAPGLGKSAKGRAEIEKLFPGLS